MGLVVWGFVATAIGMALLWARQLRTRNATSVDVAWSLALGLLAVAYAFLADGEPARRILVAVVAGAWAFRLAGYLYFARVRHESEEDGRYRAMRTHWGARAPLGFFVVYQAQAFLAALFSTFFLMAMTRPGPLDVLDVAGVLVALIAIGGELVADRQLARWRADPANRGRTCRAGLWRYSRHPNYFFEWVHWWAYVLIAWGAPWWWATLFGPGLMLLFVYRITGIPYTERQALKSRGEDYRAYQRTTSAFIPWFPKETS
jgi:steroid 5-alpha reductase family enzyme